MQSSKGLRILSDQNTYIACIYNIYNMLTMTLHITLNLFLGSFCILSFPAVSLLVLCYCGCNTFRTSGINNFSSYCICWKYWLPDSQQDYAVCGRYLYIVQGLNQSLNFSFIPHSVWQLPKRHKTSEVTGIRRKGRRNKKGVLRSTQVTSP